VKKIAIDSEKKMPIRKVKVEKPGLRINFTLTGEPERMAKEMEKLELFSSRPAMVIEAIKDLHEKEMNRLSKKLKKKTTDDD